MIIQKFQEAVKMGVEWFLFTNQERAEAAELKIAQNQSAMYPLNPWEHFNYPTAVLKVGGALINGILCTNGFPAVNLEAGYTQAQVEGYLAGVEWDTAADYPEGHETDWFDPFE
jgi:hypothetical protein